MKRNSSAFNFFLFTLFYTFLIVPKSVLKYLIKGQMTHLKNFFKGVIWNITGAKYSNL